jgi:clan AA aspartic protease (TIGR02281 family)
MQRVAFSCVLLLVGGSIEAHAGTYCVVADPTGTPLNIRTSPGGQVIKTLNNGTSVTIFDGASVGDGKWVYVGNYKDGVPIGWVYRDYLDCSRTATPQRSEPGELHPPSNASISVPLSKEGGAYSVPVRINRTITLNFVIDSGATDVSVPADVVSTLLRTGTIDRSDFIGSQTYRLADGSTVPSMSFRLKSLQVGDVSIPNVVAALTPAEGSLLLGLSFLNRFKSWSIDNAKQALLLEPTEGTALPRPEAVDSTPAPTPRTTLSLLNGSLGQWAIGDETNCQIPQKAYSLRLDSGRVVWQNGTGGIDVEEVTLNNENEFRTVTVRSIRRVGSGFPPGTNWSYLRSGPDSIQVIESGQKTYRIARCR